MLDFVHRGLYICSIAFFMLIGLMAILIGDPQYMKPLVSDGIFKMMYTSATPEADAVAVVIGAIIFIGSFILGAAGGFICRFSKKQVIPKNVDVLRAQDIAVFLVDGRVYKKDEAVFYNLTDLSRLRVLKIRNLYLMELEEDISIAPEEVENEEGLLHRDNEADNSEGANASIEEGEDQDKPFK